MHKEICSELEIFTESQKTHNIFSHPNCISQAAQCISIFLQEISQYFGNQILNRQFEALLFTEKVISIYVDGVLLNGNTFSFILKEL